MSSAEILSINIGKPIGVPYKDKEITTGIYKEPVHEPLWLTKLGFEGDGQADLVNHGGVEKAVCVYAHEHYAFWEKEMARKLEYGAFGENLTLQGVLESQVHIGDLFQLGDAIVQVSQPRQPCFKLGVKYDFPQLPLLVQQTGFTGFYLRVIQEGFVTPENKLVPLERHSQAVSVAYANQIMHHDKANKEAMLSIVEVDALSIHWRATFLKRLSAQDGE